jgi:hypothetical protein
MRLRPNCKIKSRREGPLALVPRRLEKGPLPPRGGQDGKAFAMKKSAMAMAAAALLASTAAQAQQPPPASTPVVPTRVTARTLTSLCAENQVVCMGYVLGATDALASSLVAAGRPQVFCIPAGVTNEQVTTSIQGYLVAHPEEAGSNAGLVILAGLVAAYPCR